MSKNPKFSRSNSFGQIYFGEYDQQKIRARKLEINDVSTFQLREIPNELKKWKRITTPSVESYLAEFHSEEDYYIISEAHEDLNSIQQLFESGKTLKPEQNFNLAKSIARTMLQLHALGDDYSHGHLCPSNVLVSMINQD